MVKRIEVTRRGDGEFRTEKVCLLVCSACGSKVTAPTSAPLECPRCGARGKETPRAAKPRT